MVNQRKHGRTLQQVLEDGSQDGPIHPTLGTPCREWVKCKHSFGYGVITFQGKYMGTHRASWVVANGEIPQGMHILHKCDNPPCINPEHLFLGTAADNMHDRWVKGRHTCGRGDRHMSKTKPESMARGEARSNLTNDQVIAIREHAPIPYNKLGKMYGISGGQIRSIRMGFSWTHVGGPIETGRRK